MSDWPLLLRYLKVGKRLKNLITWGTRLKAIDLSRKILDYISGSTEQTVDKGRRF